jgi:hypothetical protein
MFISWFIAWILSLFGLFDPRREVGERLRPELVEVGPYRAHTGGIDLVEPLPADLLVRHETDVLEHLQVLRDRRPAHRELERKVADRTRAIGKPLEDRSPSGVTERSRHHSGGRSDRRPERPSHHEW